MTAPVVRGMHGTYSVDAQPFASGGQAKVFNVTSTAGLVYKRFDDPLADQTDIRRLGRLTTEGRRVFLADKQKLGDAPQSSILWPIDLVISQTKSVVGIVMPRIPDRYFLAGGPARDLQWLFLRKTEPPAVAERVAILIRFAEIMAWLRERDLVHGDLNQKNLVWAIDPHPSGILIDTDGIHSSTTGLRNGVQTPFWTDPRQIAGNIAQHDVHSDAYLLSLAIYRTLYLTPGNLPRQRDGSFMKARIRAGTPELVGRMLSSALNQPLAAETRPEPKEWVEALHVTFFPKGKVNGKSVERIEQINLAESNSARSGAATRPSGGQPRSRPPTRSNAPAQPTRPTAPMSLVMLNGHRARQRLLAYSIVLAAVFGIVGAVASETSIDVFPWRLWFTPGPRGVDVRAILVISVASGVIMLMIDAVVAARQRLRARPFSPEFAHFAGGALWIGAWIALERSAAGGDFLRFLFDRLGFNVRSTLVAGFVAAHLFVAFRDIGRSRSLALVVSIACPFAFGIATGWLDRWIYLF